MHACPLNHLGVCTWYSTSDNGNPKSWQQEALIWKKSSPFCPLFSVADVYINLLGLTCFNYLFSVGTEADGLFPCLCMHTSLLKFKICMVPEDTLNHTRKLFDLLLRINPNNLVSKICSLVYLWRFLKIILKKKQFWEWSTVLHCFFRFLFKKSIIKNSFSNNVYLHNNNFRNIFYIFNYYTKYSERKKEKEKQIETL